MHRLFVPTKDAEDWRTGLADPDRQWRKGKSAYELAVPWERTSSSERGLPPDVAEVLDNTPEFVGAQLLLGIPEHKVPLDGGGHASQTDLWALLATRQGTVSMAILIGMFAPSAGPTPTYLAGRQAWGNGADELDLRARSRNRNDTYSC